MGELGVFGGVDGAKDVELVVLLRILRMEIFFCSLTTGEVKWASKEAGASVGLGGLYDSLL